MGNTAAISGSIAQFGAAQWGKPVATPADLPVRDRDKTCRLVEDDGDGGSAVYKFDKETLTWDKIADVDDTGLMIPRLALQSPVSVQALVDYLDERWRPFRTGTGDPTTINVSATGNDSSGDGSVGAPLATIQRALQLCPWQNGTAITIALGAGSFTMPPQISLANFVNIEGVTSVTATATVSTAVVATDAGGIVLQVTGITGATLDSLRGTLVAWTSGPASGRRGWIIANDATDTVAPGVTTIKVSQDGSTSLSVPAIGNTLDLLSLDTTLLYAVSAASITTSTQLNIRRCKIRGTAPTVTTVFHNATDKVDYLQCDIGGANIGRYVAGGVGRLHLFTCYYATLSTTASGCLEITNGGFLAFLDGSVIDVDRFATATRRFLTFGSGSWLRYRGETIFRGLGALASGGGLRADGCDIAPFTGVTFGVHHGFRAISDMAGVSTCPTWWRINSQNSGSAGSYQLPNSYGTGTAGPLFALTATKCACVDFGASSSLVTTTPGFALNAVSADGGTTAIAQDDDTTVILNGNPSFQGVMGALRQHVQPIPTTSGPTTTSGTFAAAIPQMTTSFTPGSPTNRVRIAFTGTFAHSISAATISIALFIDGVEIIRRDSQVGTTPPRWTPAALEFWTTLSAVAHTIEIRWLTSIGTVTAVLLQRNVQVEEWVA